MDSIIKTELQEEAEVNMELNGQLKQIDVKQEDDINCFLTDQECTINEGRDSCRMQRKRKSDSGAYNLTYQLVNQHELSNMTLSPATTIILIPFAIPLPASKGYGTEFASNESLHSGKRRKGNMSTAIIDNSFGKSHNYTISARRNLVMDNPCLQKVVVISDDEVNNLSDEDLSLNRGDNCRMQINQRDDNLSYTHHQPIGPARGAATVSSNNAQSRGHKSTINNANFHSLHEFKQEAEINCILTDQDFSINEARNCSMQRHDESSNIGTEPTSDPTRQVVDDATLATNSTVLREQHLNECDDDRVVEDEDLTLDMNQRVKCHHCKFTTKWKTSLIKHIEGRHRLNEFSCAHCSFTTNTKWNIISHIKFLHQQDSLEELKCDKCSYTTKRKKNLIKHVIIVHGSAQYRCQQCNFTTKHKSCLSSHVSGRHGKEKYYCQKCSFVTNAKINLTRHVRGQHGTEKYYCQQCTFITKNQRNLNHHVKVHHCEATIPLSGEKTLTS